MGKTAKKAADPAPPYTPTDRERQAAQRVLDRRATYGTRTQIQG